MSEPRERLRDAIAGERRDWHAVEVRPDDLAAVLDSPPDGWAWQCAGCHRPVPPMGMCETCGVFGIMRTTEPTHTIDLDSPETVERLAAEVAALVSPEMVARSSEPYAQGYINAINYVLARLAPQHPDAETLERLKREAALRPPGQRGYPEVAQHTLDTFRKATAQRPDAEGERA